MNIRLASEKDALDLLILNELFNGVSNVTVQAISASIMGIPPHGGLDE